MLGGYTKSETDAMQIHYRDKISSLKFQLAKANKKKEENSTFCLCPNLRGKRHFTIILPDSLEAFINWFHQELLPTLVSGHGKIIGNERFINEFKV
jgi:hypothetical protein